MTASETMHVVARVGAERFAFRVAEVEAAVDAPMLVPVPNPAAGLRGQLVHRDRTVPVYDAAWALGVPGRGTDAGSDGGHAVATDGARAHRADGRRTEGTALVLRVADDRVALLVDDVEDLASLDPAAIRSAPAGTDPNGLLRGVCLPRAGGAAGRGLIGVVNAVATVARASHGVAAPGPARVSPGGRAVPVAELVP
jgi:chemotaxis signal transduction protein